MNIQDRRKTLTVEELRRRYNLDSLDKDRKAIKMAKEQLNKVDSELNDFVKVTTENLKELQDQVDGNITTWFFNGVPTLNNEPANEWTTDEEKINHLGDLYYDQDTGYAYRWAQENDAYLWSKIVDTDVVKALAVANSAQDTADSKRRVFVTNPIPPYDIGDIWIKDDQDLYRCRASRESGTMNIADWIIATKYTDDTVALGTKAELAQFKIDVQEEYVSNATLETTVNSITGKVEETYEYITTVENKVHNIETTTQTSTGGNNLYITDSLESNVIEYYIEGKCKQDGTPTIDTPIEVKTISGDNDGNLKVKIVGKNLLNIHELSTKYNSNMPDVFEILEDGWIHFVNTQATIQNIWFKEIEVIPNTNYSIYCDRQKVTGSPFNQLQQLDEDYNILGISYPNSSQVITTNSNTRYIRFGLTSSNTNTACDYETKVMITKSDEIDSEYESYKEKEVLINLSKPNLLSNGIEPVYLESSSNQITDTGIKVTSTIDGQTGGAYYIRYKLFNIKDLAGKPINISTNVICSSINHGALIIGTCDSSCNNRSTLKILDNLTTNHYSTTIQLPNEITDTNDHLFMILYSNRGDVDSVAGDYVEYNDLRICEGDTNSYELCSYNNNKDKLNIINGRAIIDKTIDVINNYNGETIGADYISTTGTLSTGATVYYVLEKAKQIILSNINIPLFEGINHVILVNDLESVTSIKYYRNTPISQDYVVQQQLDETNVNLSYTTDKTNQNSSDIDKTNANLNNNYYNKDQIDVMNTSTQEIITQIKNTVETTTTATNLQISVLQEQLTNGVTSVRTETGYTFDKDGLKIQKSGSEMSSQLDNDGLVVKRNDTEVLTVRSSGVETENLTVRTYFTIGDNTRVENYKSGTGFFYIGGAN